MPRMFYGCLLVGSWFLLRSPVTAQEPVPPPTETPREKPKPPPETPPAPPEKAPPYCGPVVEKSACTHDVLLQENQEATTLLDLPVREVNVGQKAAILEVAYREERRTVTVMELKPCESEHEALSTELEPVTTVDPVTCCPHTEYKQVPVVKMVKVTHYETVPVQKEVIVKVPYLKPVNVNIVVKTLAVDEVTVPAVRKTLTAIPQHTEVTVPMPVPNPPACLTHDPGLETGPMPEAVTP